MPLLILLAFIVVPLAEIALLIKVGELIGIGATIAIVLITAMIGTALLRAEGLAVLARTREAIAAGRLPVDSVIDGVCLLVAGAFLLTPGMMTDAVGFLLFIPPLRRALAKWVFRKMMRSANVDVTLFDVEVDVDAEPPGGPRGRPQGGFETGDGPGIEGEFTRLNEEEDESREPRKRPRSKGGSPWRKR